MKRCLPLPPLTGEGMRAYEKEYACGFLAVDLAIWWADPHRSPPFQGPRLMPTVFLRNIFSSILPQDMGENLNYFKVEAKRIRLTEAEAGVIHGLKTTLDNNHCMVVWVGIGGGHWLTLWGYDDETEEFLVFDSSKSQAGKRDAHQLSRFTYHELVRLMYHEVPAQRLCNWGARTFGWRRLAAPPGTVFLVRRKD